MLRHPAAERHGSHVRPAQAALSLHPFTRVAHGLVLTEAGQSMMPAARAMQAAATELALTAAGRATGIAGSVRITASRVVSHTSRPPILARLRAEEPGI